MSSQSKHIAVAGAGIVGVCCALWLQKRGFRVTLVDGNQPGSITSSGNACTIANYGCIPVNDPDIIKRLPYYLFSRESPLTLNPAYALTHIPWMISFLKNCRATAVNNTIHSLGTILAHTDEGLDPLIESTETENLFTNNGCMYLYESIKGFEKSREKNQARADQGFKFTELDESEIKDLEPNLSKSFPRGLLFENARNVLNPQTLVTRFFEYFRHSRGAYIPDHAAEIHCHNDGVSITLASGEVLLSDKAVIASGAFSKSIKGSGIERMPLETERGYHVQYASEQSRISRPVAWAESGFYATPTNEGLRFAGTVEIAGLSPQLNQKNINFLSRKSREMFDLSGPPTSTWLGFRPTMPDSLPVIGPSIRSQNVFYAFGHQHIGLTLAGITGKLISELAAGVQPSLDIFPYRADRFS